MVELSPKALALLREQRRRYLTRLPERARELERLWQTAGADLRGFLDAVHRLAGSAGLHGLDRIQRAAAELEAGLKAQRGAPESFDPEVEALIARLREAAHEES